eukprot:m.255813 g.255813  ORF g.255813 m.255813 type:complete len:63 (-) comp11012_c0_seq17:469-657(-)
MNSYESGVAEPSAADIQSDHAQSGLSGLLLQLFSLLGRLFGLSKTYARQSLLVLLFLLFKLT